MDVTVDLDDLLLLLQKAAPLLVSPETARDPVVNAIDRLGDAVLKVRMVQDRDRRVHDHDNEER